MGRVAEKHTAKAKAMGEEPGGWSSSLAQGRVFAFAGEAGNASASAVGLVFLGVFPAQSPCWFLFHGRCSSSCTCSFCAAWGTGCGGCGGPAPPPPREGVAEPGPGSRARNREAGYLNHSVPV